ncbi:MAG: signal peptidase I [Clostridia bacterium]|nr:signal peptidase I [Clostridia bacterium]
MDEDYNGLSETEETEPVEKTEQTSADTVSFPEFCSNKKNNVFSLLFEGVDVLVTAMVAVIIVFVFVFKVPTIEGDSMNNTLFNGERVVISNLFYEPKYGDIVVISRNYTNDTDNGERSAMPLIKRVIATEGQTVDIKNGKVYVNDDELEESSYTTGPTEEKGGMSFPVTVPDNCVFVLGDNRGNSSDSRVPSIGMIDKRYILGKAFLRVSPSSKFGPIK